MRIRPLFVLSLVVAGLSSAAFLGAPKPDTPASAVDLHVASAPLLGLWQATRPEKEGDPVRFYYFHNGGIGLVRYGRMGLTYTRSFHWKVLDAAAEGSTGRLALVFTKTGAHHDVSFVLESEQAILHLPEDPAFPGNHRYTKDVRPRGVDFGAQEHPLARLWIQHTRDTRGGQGFRMYQLQAPTIDGRGVGWYHEGDMSDWSTETLTYRRTGESLELYFPVRGERFSSALTLTGEGEARILTLAEDPRNFWHARSYQDGGPGFTVALEGQPLPYSVPGFGPHRALGAGLSGGHGHGHAGCGAR
ncbi:MAG: hypothetical protein AAFZ18_15135 [Myxococcota bacterium]